MPVLEDSQFTDVYIPRSSSKYPAQKQTTTWKCCYNPSSKSQVYSGGKTESSSCRNHFLASSNASTSENTHGSHNKPLSMSSSQTVERRNYYLTGLGIEQHFTAEQEHVSFPYRFGFLELPTTCSHHGSVLPDSHGHTL